MGRVQAAALLLAGLASVAPAQAPRLDSLDPARGPIAGGTTVTVSGSGFAGASITLNGKPMALLSISDTQIRFTTPPRDNGIASIKVANATGAAYGEFLYVPPRLDELPPGYITTVAGIGEFTGFYRRATEAQTDPQGVLVFDPKGNLYFSEPGHNRVSRVRPDGIYEPFAGSGIDPNPGDDMGDGGPAIEARISFPRGAAPDSESNVYITDAFHRIRRVDGATGIITTVAGDGTPGFSGDGGPARLARLNTPSKMARDSGGTIFFIDYENFRIRGITPDGNISTVAGTGTPGFSGDGGPAFQAQFNVAFSDLGALATDSSRGLLYLADTANNRVRRIDLRTGIIDTLAGPKDAEGSPLDGLLDVAVDAAGNVYYTTFGRIREMSPTGQLIASYGVGGRYIFSEDGTPVRDVKMSQSGGLVIDSAGNIVYTDSGIQRVRRLNLATGLVETVAGIGPRVIGENGPAIATTLLGNRDVAFLPTGELLIGDSNLRKVDGNGNVSTLARGNLFAPPEWGPETFLGLASVRTDPAGNIYLADGSNAYQLDTKGLLHRLAGRPQDCGFSGDGGPAVDAFVCQPWDVMLDGAGNYLIADTNNNRIRRVDAQTGIITTVVGSGPVNGVENYGGGTFCGDGGPAIEACLNTPYGLALDPAGNLFIAELHRIRKVDARGIITTFKEFGSTKVVFDRAGYLYVQAAELERYDPAGVLTRLTGPSSAEVRFSGDGGPALEARTLGAGGIAIDAEGNIFFNDEKRVRAIRYGAVLAPPDARIQASGGTPQSAPARTVFPEPLEALVVGSSGQPAPGVRVDFSAPATGASCVFSNGTSSISVVTDRSGKAQTTCTASCRAGSYTVTARALGSTAEARFTLTTTSSRRPCTTVIPFR